MKFATRLRIVFQVVQVFLFIRVFFDVVIVEIEVLFISTHTTVYVHIAL